MPLLRTQAAYHRDVSRERATTVEDFVCDPRLFQGLSSPTMNYPTTPRNAGSPLNCKDNIPWFSFSAAAVSAPMTGPAG